VGEGTDGITGEEKSFRQDHRINGIKKSVRSPKGTKMSSRGGNPRKGLGALEVFFFDPEGVELLVRSESAAPRFNPVGVEEK
jgi:hypothetical protein